MTHGDNAEAGKRHVPVLPPSVALTSAILHTNLHISHNVGSDRANPLSK